MADFNFKISPNITLGSYAVGRLGQLVRDWGSRYMVILDPMLQDVGLDKKIKQSLDDRKIDYFIFDAIPSSPDTSVVQSALKLARDAHIHGIVAAGGSKALNIGRAVASLFNEAHDLYEYVDGATPHSAALPLICIPGNLRDNFLFSDVTPIVDGRNRQVKLLKTQRGLCKLAIFDSNVTTGLTDNQLASLKLQMLCVATECYLSQDANFFSDTICEKAIELIGYALDGAPNVSQNMPSEQFLAQAGCMTSLAAGVSATGPASLLSLTMNARYKLNRAITSAILFPYIIEDAAKYKTEKLAKVARLLKVATETTANEAATAAFADDMRNRLAMANLPSRLKDLSVTIENLILAAEDAGTLEMINHMPRSMSADDLFDFIKQAY